MALVSSTVPNLLGGVSQQAPAARARTTSQAELNTYHSLVSGLQKRPGAEWIAELYESSEESTDAVVHAFQTADNRQFLLVIDADSEGTGRAMVIDTASGQKYPVDVSGDNGYISGVSRSFERTFRFLSIGDTTFVLNRGVLPAAVPVPEDGADLDSTPTNIVEATFADLPDPSSVPEGTTARVTGTGKFYRINKFVEFPESTHPIYGHPDIYYQSWQEFFPSTDRDRVNPRRYGTVFVRQAVHGIFYTIKVHTTNGTFTSTIETPEATDANGDPVKLPTSKIVTDFRTDFNASAPSGLYIQMVSDSVIGIWSTDDTYEILDVEVTDGFGDQALRGYADSVQNFSDLAPNEREGRIVRINGAVETGGDDYFVEYRDGIWQETVAYGKRSELDPDTMPMKLVYNPVADTFTLSIHEWPGRTSGDEVSNPNPTFVGRAINDMFLFKGRMVLLADENVIFSEVGYYENFFRTTLTLLLETDPIDVAATTAQTSILHSGVAFDETLVVFSDRQQFRILSGDTLTPQNISIAPTTTFNASANVAPIAVGANILFVEDAGLSRYASIMEYYRNPNTEADDASDITSAVPKYIPSGVRSIKAAANENIVAVLSKENGGELFVYKYFWSGGEKVISSWTKWQITNCREILSVDFFSDILFLVVRDDQSRVFLLQIDTEEGKTEEKLDYRILLDMKVSSFASLPVYDEVNDRTQYRFPVLLNDQNDVVGVVSEEFGDYPAGYIIKPEAVEGRYAYFPGDTTGIPMWLGVLYSAYYTFSPFFIRGGRSGDEVVQDNRLSCRYVTVFFDDTSAFRVEVTPRGRKTWTAHYTGRKFSDQTSETDSVSFESGQFRFAAKGRTQDLQITIINDTPYPSSITSALWEGQYSPRARRV